jgi:hypothetical protein
MDNEHYGTVVGVLLHRLGDTRSGVLDGLPISLDIGFVIFATIVRQREAAARQLVVRDLHWPKGGDLSAAIY